MIRIVNRLLIPLLLIALATPLTARAQCLLANPSFELAGSSGAVFAGWNQFGSVGSSGLPTHGAVTARVSGPNTGGWDVSGYWQQFDATPGSQWTTSVTVRHASVNPLTGQCRALVNIEWRNASGGLISYESYTAADASTPRDETRLVTFTSPPAPAGTASTRLLLGVIQSPTDPMPDVYYDQATFESLGPPTLESIQWNDFPGGRTLSFSGRTWRVKGPGYYGPGPNSFSDGAGNVWVDANGRLHLTVKNVSGTWYSTEVALQDALGYGDYVFTTRGRLDNWHQNVILGLFIWEYGRCYDAGWLWWNPYNEFDIEFGRWSNPGNPCAQYVAQPYDYPGNINRFNPTFSDNEITSHAFRWLPNRVECRSWRGGPLDERTSASIRSWTYTGPHIPRPDRPRVHLNLWQVNGPPTTNHEVVLDSFTFTPACSSGPCIVGVSGEGPAPGPGAALRPAWPNPFRRAVAIRFTLKSDGPVDLTVFDLAGRRVRGLVSGERTAGELEANWDGRDDSGRAVTAGVYLMRLKAAGAIETMRVVKLD